MLVGLWVLRVFCTSLLLPCFLKTYFATARDFTPKLFNLAVVVTPLISALREQENLCEFEAHLVYKVTSRKANDTQRNPVSPLGGDLRKGFRVALFNPT